MDGESNFCVIGQSIRPTHEDVEKSRLAVYHRFDVLLYQNLNETKEFRQSLKLSSFYFIYLVTTFYFVLLGGHEGNWVHSDNDDGSHEVLDRSTS